MITLYDKALNKIISNPKLSEHIDFIFADWNEGDGHLIWILESNTNEILDWIENNR